MGRSVGCFAAPMCCGVALCHGQVAQLPALRCSRSSTARGDIAPGLDGTRASAYPCCRTTCVERGVCSTSASLRPAASSEHAARSLVLQGASAGDGGWWLVAGALFCGLPVRLPRALGSSCLPCRILGWRGTLIGNPVVTQTATASAACCSKAWAASATGDVTGDLTAGWVAMALRPVVQGAYLSLTQTRWPWGFASMCIQRGHACMRCTVWQAVCGSYAMLWLP
jgi:hypothetical protein